MKGRAEEAKVKETKGKRDGATEKGYIVLSIKDTTDTTCLYASVTTRQPTTVSSSASAQKQRTVGRVDFPAVRGG